MRRRNTPYKSVSKMREEDRNLLKTFVASVSKDRPARLADCASVMNGVEVAAELNVIDQSTADHLA